MFFEITYNNGLELIQSIFYILIILIGIYITIQIAESDRYKERVLSRESNQEEIDKILKKHRNTLIRWGVLSAIFGIINTGLEWKIKSIEKIDDKLKTDSLFLKLNNTLTILDSNIEILKSVSNSVNSSLDQTILIQKELGVTNEKVERQSNPMFPMEISFSTRDFIKPEDKIMSSEFELIKEMLNKMDEDGVNYQISHDFNFDTSIFLRRDNLLYNKNPSDVKEETFINKIDKIFIDRIASLKDLRIDIVDKNHNNNTKLRLGPNDNYINSDFRINYKIEFNSEYVTFQTECSYFINSPKTYSSINYVWSDLLKDSIIVYTHDEEIQYLVLKSGVNNVKRIDLPFRALIYDEDTISFESYQTHRYSYPIRF